MSSSVRQDALTILQNPGHSRRNHLARCHIIPRLQDLVPEMETRGFAQVCATPRACWNCPSRRNARVRSCATHFRETSCAPPVLPRQYRWIRQSRPNQLGLLERITNTPFSFFGRFLFCIFDCSSGFVFSDSHNSLHSTAPPLCPSPVFPLSLYIAFFPARCGMSERSWAQVRRYGVI